MDRGCRSGEVLAGKYLILRELARGGCGSVWLAEDLHLPKRWAVKEIKKEREDQGMELKREAMLLGGRSHPALPVVVDFLDTEHFGYLVMEYVEGVTLAEAVRQRGVFSEEECLNLLCQLAEILRYLHELRPPVCYLDLKPANVLLTEEGRVVLVDFGAAMENEGAACRRGPCYGTYGYAPPEQCGELGMEAVCDQRSDVYALGMTIFFLLTGKDPGLPPFGLKSCIGWESMAGREFVRILKTCVEWLPEKRFQSMREVLVAAEGCMAEKRSAGVFQKRGGRIGRILCRVLPGKRRFVLRQEKSIFLTGKKRAGLSPFIDADGAV
ncbi:MAG: serine/threonine protein kinase [Clostridiales bacterium]|nr:serine/threonine protein kinase [Clostridiales bacterium]